MKELKDRMLWSAGWKQRQELAWTGDPNAPGGAVARPKLDTACVVCDGAGSVPCVRKGCELGLERVIRQKQVVAETEKRFKKTLRATRARAAEDEGVRDMRQRMKRQLRDMSKAEAETTGPGGRRRRSQRNREKEEEEEGAAGAGAAANARGVGGGAGGGGDEDWGAYGRSRRDERLEQWMRGAARVDANDPEDNQ